MPLTHPSERWVHLTIDFCLRLGEMLLASGAGAADVKLTMFMVAEKLGIPRPQVDVTFTSLSMSYQMSPEHSPFLATRHVQQREIDYEDLTQVDHLVRWVMSGDIELTEARHRLSRIVHSGHQRPRLAVTVAWGAMCAAVAIQIGGSWAVVGIAALAAMVIDILKLGMARFPDFYQQAGGGTAATLIAVGGAGLVNTYANLSYDVQPSQVIATSIFMLLAGVGFMGAIHDALQGFYITSGARLIEAILATSGIIAGVSAGLSLARSVGLGVGRYDPGVLGIAGEPDVHAFLVTSSGAAVAAAMFAYASYAPRRILVPIAGIAFVAMLLHQAIETAGFGRPWAAGVGAFFVGLVSYAVSGRVGVPPLVIVVSGVIPMLPGMLIFRGLSLLAEVGGSGTSYGLLAMVTAGSVAIALAAGVLLGEYVAQPVKRFPRRLEARLGGPHFIGVRRSGRRGR